MPKGIYPRTEKHKRLMSEGWAKRNGIHTQEKCCPVCGKEIIVYASRLKRGRSKFCSIKCKSRYFSEAGKGNSNPNWRGGRHLTIDGYVMVRCPKHPRSNPAGYIREHILIAEKILGKALPDGAIVHHINENRADNCPGNLLICDRTYHNFLHKKMKELSHEQC